ncbi:MAG: fibronectin type III domain-containing protein [Acidimicrobiaceae bacterium]|nr:fibronectin type III domain-containing protein [Acidimicrobiaceae bacterium]
MLPAGRADAQQATQTFVANTGQADGGTSLLSNDLGQAFTTGSNPGGYSLTSVDVEFSTIDSALNPSHLTVGIHAASNGFPGSSLGTLTNPASFPASTSDQTLTFTSSAGIDLAASTTYFLVLDASSDNASSSIRNTASDSEDSGALAGWSIGNRDVSRAWNSTGPYSNGASALKISLGGEVKPFLVSNSGQANGGTGNFVQHDHAQAFTTGDNADGYTLTGVDFSFPQINDGKLAGKLTAEIRSDSSGAPGAVVATLTKPGTISAGTNSFTHAGVQLDASTTYWVVLDVTLVLLPGANTIQNTGSDAEDAGGADGFTISDTGHFRTWNTSGGWSSFAQSRKITIHGTPVGGVPYFVGNLGQAGGAARTDNIDFAQAFTTGPNRTGYSLRSVDVRVGPIATGFNSLFFAATIRDGSGAAPGPVLGTLTDPSFAANSEDQTLTFTSAAGIDLEPNTTYFLEINAFGPTPVDFYAHVTTSGAEDSGGQAGWSIADSLLTRAWNISAWSPNSGRAAMIRLDGVSKPPPPFVANTGQADGGTSFLGNDFHQAFTTGSNGFGYDLRSVDVEFSTVDSSFDSSALTASIHAASGGSPGSSLGTLTNPASFPASTSDQTLTFTSAGIDLEAGTTYFLVIDMDAGQSSSRLRLTGSDAEDSGASDGWSIADGAGTRTASSTGAWTPNVSSLKIGLGGFSKTAPPRVSILGGGAVTEGSAAVFTLTASPAPAEDLDVSVSVATTGDFGYPATPPTSVTIPASSGSATLTIATTGDDADESDGSVTVTVADGEDYDLATSLGTATVRVRDDDPPLVKNTGQSSGLVQGLHVDLAQGFDTGSNPSGYVLTSVDVAFRRSTEDFSEKLTVTVHKNANGAPGTVVGTLANPAWVDRQDGTYSFTHPGVALEADTRYWVVLDSALTETRSQVKFTQSNSEDDGAAPGWSINNDARIRAQGGSNWITLVGGSTLSMQVNGRLLPHSDGSYTVPSDWPLKPLGLGAGETFRLMFMTEDHRDATATDIGVYDAHVREAARDGHAAIRRYADDFRVVGSTAMVDARDHTGTNPGDAGHTDAEVWWLNGERIAADHAGFWSDTWENWAMADRRFESGEPSTSNDWPWTGTRTDGRKEANPLGASNARRGRFSTTDADTGPISYNTTASTQDHAFYGMSPLFRVEPTPVNAPPGEPAVMSNLGQADGAALTVTAASAVRDRAQSFTTGRNGGHYRLNSVDVEFAEIGDADAARDLRVQIWAGSGGSPGSTAADVLADLARPSMPVGSADRTFTFTYQGDDGSGLQLEPNTTYWVYVYDASVQPNSTYALRATASNSERLQGLRLPEGWSIGDGHSSWSLYPNPAVSWSTHSESLKIGLNLGAADAFVQFRTCAGTVSGNSCDTGWVTANHNRHDPPPTITLTEGGGVVTYQWQAVDPHERRHFYVAGQVAEPDGRLYGTNREGRVFAGTRGGYMGPGGPDRDRLMCHTGSRSPHSLGDPIVDGLSRDGINFGYGSTAGVKLDRHDGCPFEMQFVYEDDTNKWRPVSVAAGQDSDAFDHQTYLIHRPRAVGHWYSDEDEDGESEYAESFDYPEVRVPLIIRDDDEWEQTLEFSIDDGTTWTSIEDGGLNLAFPKSLNTGTKAHYFRVRTKNDAPADESKRFSISADFAEPLLRSGTAEYFRSHRVWFTSPAASHLHTFRTDTAVSAGSVTVGRTPVQVEIHVGANVVGNVTFQVEAYKLYERSDNQISTETPPVTVRTDSFSFYRTLGSCVGCQRLAGDLPDPVVERVGDLGYANLSDSGIDLSWPRVVGAEGYQVRWWSTTSPFPGVPAEEAWFGAEPNDPAWAIRHLEPDTEYRAVVYYADHGATQLSTASPVIRFTTLSAGSPVQADPASVVVERVPEVSISAAAGTVTEGGDAVFTVTVDPAPDAPLDVRVRVAGAGSVVAAAHLGERTVNVPTGGSTAFTVPTVDDSDWGSNGMLGATVQFGDGYRQSRFNSYATVYVANNDLPPPPPVQLKRVSDTTATVAWKPQGDGASYLVVWHESFKGIPVLTEVTTAATEHQLTGLNPGSHYVVSVLHGTNQLDKITVTTLAAGATPETFAVDFDTPAPSTSQPVISVTASGDVTEGADAVFTVTANPAPAADLDVSVTVTRSDDSGTSVGQQTVTIPAAGYATLTVATDNDETDEPDGSVTVAVDASAGLDYRVSSSQGTAVVAVADDDGGYTVNPGTIAKVRNLAAQTQHGTAHVNRWNRVLVAFGEHDGTGVTGGPMTAAEAQQMADRHSSNVWDLVVAELTALEAAAQQTPPPPPTPEVSVTAGSGITEGGDATFTVTASPAPAADLAVTVTVSQSGDWGAATGQRTVTVPATGSVTVTVGTADDSTDETDGSVTATVNTGSGYTVSATQGAAAVAVADNDAAPTPAVSVTGASGGTEGDPVTFTVTASPAPAADLAVTVTVATTGDYGYSTLPTSVTIPTSGTATVTVATADDTADEPDGSVTLTVDPGSGYTVAAPSSQTADVADDDAPAGHTVDPDVIAKVRNLAAQTQHGAAHVNRWNRVLVAFGEHDGTGVTGGPMTAAQAQQMANTHSSPVWDEVAAELAALETAALQTPPPPPPPPTPEVSITAGSAVTEGGTVTFTVTASPAPAADLDVTVTITAAGDHGAATGTRTVTIPTTGSATVTVATTDDTTDEPDGTVTAAVDAGSGYTVSAAQGAATVAVADDDDPPPVVPVVSIAGGSGVTEGGSVTFTLTASPAPSSNLDVSVTVSQSGDWGAATGTRTVTIPTTGSATLAVATADDSADEPDGSVTVTLNTGSGYTGSGTATVAVADDDDPPVEQDQPDQPDQPDQVPLAACAARPTLLISSPEASRSDASVDFEVSLSCIPASSPIILLSPVRDGRIGQNLFINLSADQTSTTVTVTIGNEHQLGLAVVWSSGLANRYAQGDVTYTD